ncbi:hypothetical protein [Kingella kingae]|nr:hypothetical protein [Kingella kingae]
MTLHTSLAQTVQHTLNNGLNVIIEEDHRAPVVHLAVIQSRQHGRASR